MDMSTRWKLATALGLAGAIALAVPSAEARSGRNAAIGFGIGALALGAAVAASQPRYYYGGYHGGPYAYGPVYDSYDSYGYYDVPAAPVYYEPRPYRGNRQSLQIPGTNYNPNQ
jgi:hypothetical protein